MTESFHGVADELRRLDDHLAAAVPLPAPDTVIRKAGAVNRASTAAAVAVTTTSASGERSVGCGVTSTMGMPRACAAEEIPAMSSTTFAAFDTDSANHARVSGREARSHASGSFTSSTKSTSMPRRPKLSRNSPRVPS